MVITKLLTEGYKINNQFYLLEQNLAKSCVTKKHILYMSPKNIDCHNKEMTHLILVIRLEPSRWAYCIPHSWVVHCGDDGLTWTALSTGGMNLSLQFREAKDNGMKKWKCTQTLDSKHYTRHSPPWGLCGRVKRGEEKTFIGNDTLPDQVYISK